MEINIDELTPMMQKYMETKQEYKDCILFYRLGDFYEMFFEDATDCIPGAGNHADRKRAVVWRNGRRCAEFLSMLWRDI